MEDITLNTLAGRAIYFCGLPEAPFKNITLRNITAHGKYGIETKNIEGLTMDNVQVITDGE